jgi:hypothetical protein
MALLLIGVICLHARVESETPGRSSTPSTTAAIEAVVLFKAFESILDAGPVLWNKITQSQATDTLQAISTGSADIAETKKQLASDILKGNIANRAALKVQIDKLHASIKGFSDDLKTFGTEIESSAPDNAVRIRKSGIDLANSKLIHLDNALHFWNIDDASRQKSAGEIRNAMNCADDLAIVTGCLKRSILAGKLDGASECTAPAIEEYEHSCETSAVQQ